MKRASYKVFAHQLPVQPAAFVGAVLALNATLAIASCVAVSPAFSQTSSGSLIEAESSSETESGLPESFRSQAPNWIRNSGSQRETTDSISVELGQDVLVDRLNDSPEVLRRSSPPSVVILQERSSGQQFILNPGQDIALVLPQNLVNSSRGQGLRYPLPYVAPVSSGFGIRVHPITGLSSFHSGIDLAAPTGTPILAAYSGQVIASGPAGNLGNAVVLAHDDNRRTRYGHMSSVAVAANTWVEQGDVIGYVGSTGRSTGPHLHFEFWVKRDGLWLAEDISDRLRAAVASLRAGTPVASQNSRNASGGN